MNEEHNIPEPCSRRLLHAWAVLTVLLALPLVLLGAEVTTKQVGMVDPAWPTSPVHLFGVDWADRGIGYLIEHGHRLAGYCVGFAAVVLAVGLWFSEPRRWVRWLGVAALAGVCVQGLLGGLRVLLHQQVGPTTGTTFALIHGCFGQLVFALLVSVALVTARGWRTAQEFGPAQDSAPLRRWTLTLTLLVCLQLVLGAFVRHRESALAQRGHLLVAFAVVAVAAWLVKLIFDRHADDGRLAGAARWLAGLIVMQIALGVEAWMVKFASPEPVVPGHWLWNRELARSGHVLVGALVLATSAALTLEAWRRTSWAWRPVPLSRLEGAA